MRFRSSDVVAATGGHLVGPDVELDGASFDSRSIRPGSMFVALVAERDGHEFVDAAFAAGAAAALVSRPPGALPPARAGGRTTIHVDDTAEALMHLAAWMRRAWSGQVVGITGSVGKTSTKDLVVAALAGERRVTANERSFNNEQGLPVTILGAPADTEVLVLEMGMRGVGQIRRLCDVGRPSIGVVTAVGEAHTELLGGIDGVARAKRELVEALPAHGTAVLNADDERVAAMAAHSIAGVVTYGTSQGADVRIVDLTLDELARPSFRVETPWGSAAVRLPVTGVHMARNAAAAIAVAGSLDVAVDAASAGLAGATLSAMRMEVHRTPSGAAVLDDTYNANPTSMRAALEALAEIDADRRVAVLGEMAELDDPARGHRDIAALAADLGIEVIAVGTSRYGSAPVDDPVAALGPLTDRTAVLFKASRVVALEREVRRLLAAT